MVQHKVRRRIHLMDNTKVTEASVEEQAVDTKATKTTKTTATKATSTKKAETAKAAEVNKEEVATDKPADAEAEVKTDAKAEADPEAKAAEKTSDTEVKAEAPKVDDAKAAAAKTEASKTEASKTEDKKAEEKKAEAKKEEPAKMSAVSNVPADTPADAEPDYPFTVKLKRAISTYRGSSLSLKGKSFGGKITVLSCTNNGFYHVSFVRSGVGLTKAYMLRQEVERCRS